MNQHQDYDKIIKETMERIGRPILQKLLKIDASSIENLPLAVPRTIERRADFLKIGVDSEDGIKKLFHLEFQSNNHDKMLQRFLVYFSLFFERYNLPVKQYVIYLGLGRWTATTKLKMENISFEYEVICLNTIDYELFVNSELSEEIILAILADFKKENNYIVIQKIVTALKNKTKNKKKLQKLIFQLEILSNLRNLQPEITKILSNMPIYYDVTKDLRYQQGVENSKIEFIQALLKKGTFSLKEISELTGSDIDTVISVYKKMGLK